MPILPTVDYSPIADAIAGKGRAEQAGYQNQLASLSDQYRTLQKSEEKRQAIFGTIDGALRVATQVYGIMEQSKMEVGKQALIQQSAENQKYIEEARLNGKIFIGQDATGQATIEVNDEVTQYFENQVKALDDNWNFAGFGRVKEQLKTTLVQTQAGSLEQARTALFQRAQADGIAAHVDIIGNALTSAIASGDFGIYEAAVNASGTTTPNGKALELSEGRHKFELGIGASRVRKIVAEKGYVEGMEYAGTFAGTAGELYEREASAIGQDRSEAQYAAEEQQGKRSDKRQKEQSAALSAAEAVKAANQKKRSAYDAERAKYDAEYSAAWQEEHQMTPPPGEAPDESQNVDPDAIYAAAVADAKSRFDSGSSEDEAAYTAAVAQAEQEYAVRIAAAQAKRDRSTPISEDDRTYLKAVAIQADKEAEAAALESSSTRYEAMKQEAEKSGTPFMPDATIRQIAGSYPESRRPVVEAQLRKAQTYSDLRAGTEQFNADRDNPSLTYLEKQYNTIQADPMYDGDELTRSTVMSWYEGLIGNMKARTASESSGASRAAEDNALALLEGNFTMFEAGNIPGPQAIRTIEELMNSGQISGPQAAAAKKRITEHEFPQAKMYLANSQAFAMGALGFKKKYAEIGVEAQRKVNALSSSYEAYISDRLFEQGADADLDKISKDALTAVTSKAFDEVRQGFSLFKSREDITESAMAKTIGAFDTPAGAALTFEDRHGNIKYLSENPEQTASTIETVAQYGKEQLEARGVKVASWKLESEGMYDVTSMPIFIGADGLQYRMKQAGDEVEYYSRGSESAQWKKLQEPSKPAAAPVVMPGTARPGATTTAPASTITPVTDEAYAAALAREAARQEAIRKAAEEAAKKDAARKGHR